MLGDTDFQIVSMTDIEAAIIAVEHVGPEGHVIVYEKGEPFDKLRANGEWGRARGRRML
jgi:hypothetical protein